LICLRNASRWYGQVIGINDITADLPPGLTALLGPNGAGKSTLIKLITGILRPTTGSVLVFGERPFANTKVYRRLGYCPEIDGLYESMTGREFVTAMAAVSGLKGALLRKKVDEAISLVGMEAAASRVIGGYSKGMKQRIKLAQAIVHDPDVLVLDEPLSGLDPIGRRDMTNLICSLAQQGKCIVVSSHILHEVEQMTSNILLLYRGRLLASGDVYHIRSLIDKHPHRVQIETSEPRLLAAELMRFPHVVSVRFSDGSPNQVEVETKNPEAFYSQLPDVVLEGDFEITAFESLDNNLEAVFRYLTEG
jgi:ABC-2 type transport system ATP-binding protein